MGILLLFSTKTLDRYINLPCFGMQANRRPVEFVVVYLVG